MRSVVYFLALSILLSCKHQSSIVSGKKDIPVILVSKDYGGRFNTWLKNSSDNYEFKCINMYIFKNKDSIEMLLKNADGIIISGGEDVNPALYGKENELDRCGTINIHRDSLEQKMIRYAIKNKIPLLGVCRGHQILNVTQGGNLIVDIPADVGSKYLHRDLRKAKENKSTAVYHKIYVKKGTFLHSIVKVDSGQVYSNHHQAVNKPAENFVFSAYAKDGVVEAEELSDTLSYPFLLGVQWHPEAMNTENSLSGKIGIKFVNKVKEHFKSK